MSTGLLVSRKFYTLPRVHCHHQFTKEVLSELDLHISTVFASQATCSSLPSSNPNFQFLLQSTPLTLIDGVEHTDLDGDVETSDGWQELPHRLAESNGGGGGEGRDDNGKGMDGAELKVLPARQSVLNYEPMVLLLPPIVFTLNIVTVIVIGIIYTNHSDSTVGRRTGDDAMDADDGVAEEEDKEEEERGRANATEKRSQERMYETNSTSKSLGEKVQKNVRMDGDSLDGGADKTVRELAIGGSEDWGSILAACSSLAVAPDVTVDIVLHFIDKSSPLA
ncbi:unnamed protein product [Hydatigera taeniaeformis]|uniref:DUF4408 domain-containing protein n=1 Tax=Hydatigena taeniaeformis TaxID=6205 RepID=A0A0R3WPH1_HYDTA|nr:unnamed protein product [Hydatigera taeniaeformis]